MPGRGPEWAVYELTPEGRKVYTGSDPFPFRPASFCPPAGRHLASIVDLQWEKTGSPPGLEVTFSHRADDLPPSARAEAGRKAYASRWPVPVQPSHSWVFLYRVWKRSEDPLKNAPRSGKLEEFCYDYAHNLPESCGMSFQDSLPLR